MGQDIQSGYRMGQIANAGTFKPPVGMGSMPVRPAPRHATAEPPKPHGGRMDRDVLKLQASRSDRSRVSLPGGESSPGDRSRENSTRDRSRERLTFGRPDERARGEARMQMASNVVDANGWSR